MSEGIDTVKARKRRLEVMRRLIERETEWTPYERYEAIIGVNLGIRPQVIYRDFNMLINFYGSDNFDSGGGGLCFGGSRWGCSGRILA